MRFLRSYSPNSRRRRRLVVALATWALALLALGAGSAVAKKSTVLEKPVSFKVKNVNSSRLACATNGDSYTIRGAVVGTKSELESSSGATLYLHGLGLGEFFWNYRGQGGSYDFAAQEARQGHVSVVVNRLGYLSSQKPEGFGSCIGGQATIAHQIIGQLKQGSYSGKVTPKFRKVGLIGHSAGGQITQVEAYSFGDASAIGVLAYADTGFSAVQLKAAADAKAICLAGGEPSDKTSGPVGYAALGQTGEEARLSFFASTPLALQNLLLPDLTLNPCGDLASYETAPATNLANLGRIKVPVLAVQGGADTLFPAPDVAEQSKRFTGSPKVTYALLPKSAHALTFESEHLKLMKIVSKFLKSNGL